MQIHFPLLSILSVGFLLFFALQGGDVTLHSIELGFSATPDGVRITVDPAVLIWSDHMYPNTCLGETFGNVAVVWSPLRNTIRGEWVKRFEVNHITQFYALSWWSYPAKFVIPIDPVYCPKHWDDPTEADRAEWLPLDGWCDLWHFISFSVRSQ